MADNLRDLPSTADGRFQERVREALQVLRGNRGDPLDAAITWRSAIAAGLASIIGGGPGGTGGGVIVGGGPGGGTAPDLTPPPTVSSLTASAAISDVIVQWGAASYTQGHGPGRTDIYAVQRDPASGAAAPTFTDAVIVGSAPGASPILAIPSNPNTKWFIWAKFVTVDGVASAAPAGGTNGVQVTTGQDVTTLLQALTAAAQNTSSPYSKIAFRADLFYIGDAAGTFSAVPFYVATTSFTQNGVTVPPGVYMTSAYIANGTISNAMIGNAVIDDAKIANLSAAKIIAGSIGVGEYIQSTGFVSGSSGWKIGGNGVAEFSGVIVRGTIFASAGAIGGATIDSTGVQSNSYSAGSAGWRLDNAAGIVYAASVHVQDSTGTRILNTDATGSAVAFGIGSNFWIHGDGSAFFGGKLQPGIASSSAATGSATSSVVSGTAMSNYTSGNITFVPSFTSTGGTVHVSLNLNVWVQTHTGTNVGFSVRPVVDGSYVFIAANPWAQFDGDSFNTNIGMPGGATVQPWGLVQNLSYEFDYTPSAGAHSYGCVVYLSFRDNSGGFTPISGSSMYVEGTGTAREFLA